MVVKQNKIWLGLRAAVALLALALGWISTPISLATIEPDVCEMECCIAEGHCCCATRRPYVKGHEPKPGEVSITVEMASIGHCPAGCAASGISAKNKLLRTAHAQAPLVTLASVPPEPYQSPFLLDHQYTAQPSSPRAPPAYDGHIA
jgi:hypothetical protein